MDKLYLEHRSSEKPQSMVYTYVDKDYKRGLEGDIQEVVTKTDTLAKRALVEVEAFYKTSLTKDVAVYITDRDGMDRGSMGDKTHRWVVGLRSSKGIYLLDPHLYANTAKNNGYEPETDHFYDEVSYYRRIKHEIGHEVFECTCGIPPGSRDFLKWFNEGVQYYMAGQLVGEPKTFDTAFLHDNLARGRYQNQAQVIKKLVEKFGEEEFRNRLLSILNTLRIAYLEIGNHTTVDESDKLKVVFEVSFEKEFGIKPNDEDLNNLVNPARNLV